MLNEPVRGGFPEPGFYSLPGIEQARALLRGLVPRPPLSHLIGHRVTQVGPGSATVNMPASPWLVDSNGVTQLPVLIEESLSLAALTGAPPGMEVSTATLSTHYLRPANVEREAFVARARVVNSGRTYTLAEVAVEDAAGRGMAQGTASLLVRPMDPPPPPLAAAPEPLAGPTYATPDPFLRPAPRRDSPGDVVEPQWLERFARARWAGSLSSCSVSASSTPGKETSRSRSVRASGSAGAAGSSHPA